MTDTATTTTPQTLHADHQVTVRLESGQLTPLNVLLQTLANDGYTARESAHQVQVLTADGRRVTGALVSYFKMTLHVLPADAFGPGWQPVLVPLGDVAHLTVR